MRSEAEIEVARLREREAHWRSEANRLAGEKMAAGTRVVRLEEALRTIATGITLTAPDIARDALGEP